MCVEFLASNFNDLSRCISKFTGWVIIEELSIRRRLRTFLISWGQKMRVKHCYVDLSSRVLVYNMYRYERDFRSFYHNPTIAETVSIIASKLANTENLFHWNTTTGNNSGTDGSLLRTNVKIKCKEYFSRWPVGVKSNNMVFRWVPWLRTLLPHMPAHGRQSERQNIMDRMITWQKCSVTILEDILTTKYGLNLR